MSNLFQNFHLLQNFRTFPVILFHCSYYWHFMQNTQLNVAINHKTVERDINIWCEAASSFPWLFVAFSPYNRCQSKNYHAKDVPPLVRHSTTTEIITITKTLVDEVGESKFRIMMKKRGKVFIRQSHEYKCGLLRNRTQLWELDRQTHQFWRKRENAFRGKKIWSSFLQTTKFYDASCCYGWQNMK